MSVATRPTALEAARLQRAIVAGKALAGSALVEVRWRRPEGGMGQAFEDAARASGTTASTVVEFGADTDTYIGGALRSERRGGKSAVGAGWCLWRKQRRRERAAA